MSRVTPYATPRRSLVARSIDLCSIDLLGRRTQRPEPLLDRLELLLPRGAFRVSEDELAPEFPGLGDVESILDLLEDEVAVVLRDRKTRREVSTVR